MGDFVPDYHTHRQLTHYKNRHQPNPFCVVIDWAQHTNSNKRISNERQEQIGHKMNLQKRRGAHSKAGMKAGLPVPG